VIVDDMREDFVLNAYVAKIVILYCNILCGVPVDVYRILMWCLTIIGLLENLIHVG
jgi:hypothetical protein